MHHASLHIWVSPRLTELDELLPPVPTVAADGRTPPPPPPPPTPPEVTPPVVGVYSRSLALGVEAPSPSSPESISGGGGS